MMIVMCCNGAAYQPEFKFVPAGTADVLQAAERQDEVVLVR